MKKFNQFVAVFSKINGHPEERPTGRAHNFGAEGICSSLQEHCHFKACCIGSPEKGPDITGILNSVENDHVPSGANARICKLRLTYYGYDSLRCLGILQFTEKRFRKAVCPFFKVSL